ncbi:FAD binding domain-containing protein [Pusillimonas noertemannii]|uniref:FAD binding domain-containing protein n=1 Tax=Pusillimonas noertemannii TaxID=305977 RepID=UPI0033401866
MKPAKFEYHAPKTLDEAVNLLGRYGEDARILAGGQSLVPLLNFRIFQPQALISINHCAELAYLRVEPDGLVCGALTRQAEAEQSADVQDTCPLLSAALPWIGGVSNRNRGTVCGSLAHADPLAELTAVAMALDARFSIVGTKGRRQASAAEFFLGDLTTCIEPGEMLEAVHFPRSGKNASAAFVEVGNRWHGFAVVGVGAHVECDDVGVFQTVRLSAIGVGSTPVRLTESEKILQGTRGETQALQEACNVAAVDLDPPGGFHADSAYKSGVLGTLVERALNETQALRLQKEAR